MSGKVRTFKTSSGKVVQIPAKGSAAAPAPAAAPAASAGASSSGGMKGATVAKWIAAVLVPGAALVLAVRWWRARKGSDSAPQARGPEREPAAEESDGAGEGAGGDLYL